MKNKPTLLVIFKILVSALILTWLFKDLNIATVLGNMALLPLWGWSAALLLYLLAQILSALRWQLIAQTLELKGSFSQYCSWYFLGMYYNLFLPTGMGGDVVKSYSLGKQFGKQLVAAYSVFIDRLSGLLALLLICAGALWFVSWGDAKINQWISYAILSGIAFIPFAKHIVRMLQKSIPKLHGWLKPLNSLFEHPLKLIAISVLALLIQLAGILLVIGLGNALQIRLDWSFYIISWTIITLATLLPFSINGIGIRETGFVYLFQTQQIPEEQSIALSFLTFCIPLLGSLLGLIPFCSSSFFKSSHATAD